IVSSLGGSAGTHEGVSTRLLLVYFGLCFIAVGNALYGFFCPQEVKAYPSANAYIVGDGDSIRGVALKAIGDRLESSDFSKRYLELESRYLTPRGVISDLGDQEAEMKNELLRVHFDFLNSRHRPVRITSAVTYIIGFFCLGVSSLQVFFRVIGLLFRNIFG